MRKILFILFLFSFSQAESQVFYRRSEYGFAVGGANYFGDLNQNYSFKNLRYSGGVFLKYNFTFAIGNFKKATFVFILPSAS